MRNHINQEEIKSRLRAARALIDRPEHWTKGSNERYFVGDLAPSYCAFGAILEVCLCGEDDEVVVYLERSIHPNGALGITAWNDNPKRTHAEVMLAFDRAISD